MARFVVYDVSNPALSSPITGFFQCSQSDFVYCIVDEFIILSRIACLMIPIGLALFPDFFLYSSSFPFPDRPCCGEYRNKDDPGDNFAISPEAGCEGIALLSAFFH
jgi:hypothetical protein